MAGPSGFLNALGWLFDPSARSFGHQPWALIGADVVTVGVALRVAAHRDRF